MTENVSSNGTSKPPAGIRYSLLVVEIKCSVILPLLPKRNSKWCDISLGICSTVKQVPKNCFILIAQAYGSTDFDDLFVSLYTFNLWTGFAFCQVELRYKWYPLNSILLSNEYIVLTCYYIFWKARSRKGLCHKISQNNNIRIPYFKRKTKIGDRNSWALDARAGRWTLGSGRWTLDTRLWMLDSGHWTLDARFWTLNAGIWTLDTRRWTLDAELWMLEDGHWTLDSGPWALNPGLWTLDSGC